MTPGRRPPLPRHGDDHGDDHGGDQRNHQGDDHGDDHGGEPCPRA